MNRQFTVPTVLALEPYKVSRHSAWQVGSSDADVLKLDWNESTIAPSPLVIERVIDAISSGRLNWYPDLRNEDLLEKLATYCAVSEKNVEYFASSDAAHECIAQSFLSEGDMVLMLYPTYDNFRVVCELNGAKVIREDVQDISDLQDTVKRYRPKLVYLCNPNNPTGHVLSYADVEDITAAFPESLFIVDEAYYEFSGVTAAQLATCCQNIIVTRTFSKAFGLASFRVGYAISCLDVLEVLRRVKNHKSVPLLSQIAAIAALEDVAYMKKFVSEVEAAKQTFIRELNMLPWIVSVKSGAGNFCLFKCEVDTISRLSEYLEDRKVFIRSFAHLPGQARITIGTASQMSLVATVFQEFCP